MIKVDPEFLASLEATLKRYPNMSAIEREESGRATMIAILPALIAEVRRMHTVNANHTQTIEQLCDRIGELLPKRACDCCGKEFPEDEVSFLAADSCSAGTDTWACDGCRRGP